MATLPAGAKFTSIDWGLDRDDAVLPRMGPTDIIIQGRRARWAGTLRPIALNASQAPAWRAFLAQISSLAESFQVLAPGAENGPATGYAGADPAVAGANQLGTSLTMDGVTPSAAVLKAGDYFEVNGELKMAMADATADGSGNLTVSFEPELRASPADNAAVEIQAPMVTVRLANPGTRYNLGNRLVHVPSELQVVEVL